MSSGTSMVTDVNITWTEPIRDHEHARTIAIRLLEYLQTEERKELANTEFPLSCDAGKAAQRMRKVVQNINQMARNEEFRRRREEANR